jgi:hypothetical protein
MSAVAGSFADGLIWAQAPATPVGRVGSRWLRRAGVGEGEARFESLGEQRENVARWDLYIEQVYRRV